MATNNGTYIEAIRNAVQAVADNVETQIIYNIKSYDVKSEYDELTGIFKPKSSGLYLITFSVNVKNSRFSGTRELYFGRDGFFMPQLLKKIAGQTEEIIQLSFPIKLTANEEISFWVASREDGTDSEIQTTGSFLNIVQISDYVYNP